MLGDAKVKGDNLYGCGIFAIPLYSILAIINKGYIHDRHRCHIFNYRPFLYSMTPTPITVTIFGFIVPKLVKVLQSNKFQDKSDGITKIGSQKVKNILLFA